MAKMKNKRNMTSSRNGDEPSDEMADFNENEFEASAEDFEEVNAQAAGSRQRASAPMRRSDDSGNSDSDTQQLFGSAREFIEGHPGRAALIGALLGGAAVGLFATERGRSLMSAAYGYARPMISDFARKFADESVGERQSTLTQ